MQKRMVKLAYSLRETLQDNNLDDFGSILNEGWLQKRSLVKGISNNDIDDIYKKGIEAGALGGKLLGAGGGGFLLFYCEKDKQESLKKAMERLMIVPFNFMFIPHSFKTSNISCLRYWIS